MTELADLMLTAGRAGVELAFFVLLPVMILMLTLMRLLERWGLLDRVVRLATPVLAPLGVPGLGVFAMLQILLVSFAAPVATLATMDRNGISDRHIAATLAMVLVLAQANVVFPMAALGLNVGLTLVVSLLSGLLAAALCYHLLGRSLNTEEKSSPTTAAADDEAQGGVLALINRAGKDAWDIALGALPMLVLALAVVYALRGLGAIGWLETALAPALATLDLPREALLPIVSKFIAGGTAMMGVAADALNQGLLSPQEFNRLAGLLIHPLDLAGVAVLMSAGRRVAAVVKPALWAALIALCLRALVHFWIF